MISLEVPKMKEMGYRRRYTVCRRVIDRRPQHEERCINMHTFRWEHPKSWKIIPPVVSLSIHGNAYGGDLPLPLTACLPVCPPSLPSPHPSRCLSLPALRRQIEKQARVYDREGAYTRHWLPELAALPATALQVSDQSTIIPYMARGAGRVFEYDGNAYVTYL